MGESSIRSPKAPSSTKEPGPHATPATSPRTVDERSPSDRSLSLDNRSDRDDERPRDATEPAHDEVVLDPSARSLAQLAPPAPLAPSPAVTAEPPATAAPTIDPTIMAAVVEVAAFWGDGARGLARLRFGHRARGGLSGATVTLVHEEGTVAVRVDGADDAVTERLRERLAAAGVAIDGDR